MSEMNIVRAKHGHYRVIGTRPVRHDGEEKVTGRAQYGADLHFADQLHGAVLRSPHAHARILRVDTSAALALPGVQAVVTSADFTQLEDQFVDSGEGVENLRYATDRLLARDKALYKGHPIAAVAASDIWIAEEACQKIVVEYEVLPAYVNVEKAMAEDAIPLLGEISTVIMGQQQRKATNVCHHTHFERGNLEDGFAAADLVVEREFRTSTVHQGYIEPHNAIALARTDGHATVWTSTQGGFMMREQIATALQRPLSMIKVVPMEIGGGFGGKIMSYLEPLAVLLSEKTGTAVKFVMSRADVFQGSGPASSTVSRVKMGVKQDGTITAADVWMAFESGAFPGQWGAMGANCCLACYKTPNMRISSFDVLTNTPKVSAYRAPSSPQAMFAVEGVMSEIAEKLGMDPLELRMKNAVEESDLRPDGLVHPRIGLKETIRAAQESAHFRSAKPTGKNRGRGVALGYWHNAGLQSSAEVIINMDGTASVVTGSVDIGGTRAAMAMITAETLGLEAAEVRPSVADTESIGHTDVTGGSRVTYATGHAVYAASLDALQQMSTRVAQIWETDTAQIEFREGAFHHKQNGHAPLTVKALASHLESTGGPVLGRASLNTNKGVGAGFGVHIADVEVDPETGKTQILRYTVVQDVGCAIHPSYVEGQMMGGAVQGIGWALNEEYCFNERGEMMNPGFLDYRMPTFLDVPDIDTIIVEVPNPGHPYGVRGVGETPIVPPLATLQEAIARAVNVRMYALPMSPPRVLAAIHQKARPHLVAA